MWRCSEPEKGPPCLICLKSVIAGLVFLLAGAQGGPLPISYKWGVFTPVTHGFKAIYRGSYCHSMYSEMPTLQEWKIYTLESLISTKRGVGMVASFRRRFGMCSLFSNIFFGGLRKKSSYVRKKVS